MSDSPTRTHFEPAAQLAVGSVVAGRYRILDSVGIGGMGLVYRAQDQQLDIEVALKVLRPELGDDTTLVERFRQELLLGRKVSHRNVVRIHDLGSDGELQFLTMDLVVGRSLREVLEQDGALEPERALAIFRQLVEAMAAAHDEGIVHRDLKPANILVDEQDRAYVTDFGIARSITGIGLTVTGTVIGTPDYLSPEQARGEQVDGRSDLYTLGLILFEMLSAKLPFSAETEAESLAQRLVGRPQTLSEAGVDASRQIQRVLELCLRRDPARRFHSARELLSAIDGNPSISLPAVEPEHSSAPDSGSSQAIAVGNDSSRRRPGIGAVGVAMALAVIVVLAVVALFLAASRKDAAATGASGSADTQRLALAILPLRDETGRPELSWATTGVLNVLRRTLAESPRLEIVDGERVQQALQDLKLENNRWDGRTLQQLADLFDADRLVVGSLRAQRGELWVEAELIDPVAGGNAVTLRTEPSSDPSAAALELGNILRQGLDLPAMAASTHEPAAAALADFAAGLSALDRGDHRQAVERLQNAVAIDPGFTDAWLGLSEVHQRLGHSEQSLDAADRAVETLAESNSHQAFDARARRALAAGDLETAIEQLEALLAAYPGDTEKAVLLGDLLGQTGRMPEAIAELRAVTERAPDHPRAWYLLSKYSILSGDSRSAADEYLVRAMVIQNKLKNARGRADVLNAYGVAYRNLGELGLAEDNYRQSAQIRKEAGDQRGLATSLRNLALIATLRGAYDRSSDSLRQAREILEQLDDQAGIAEIENDLGVLAEEQGKYDRALEHFRNALALQRDLGDQRAVATSLNNIGYANYLLGDYDNAAVYSQQALDLYRSSGNRRGEALALQTIGQLHRARGEWQEASAAYLEALAAAREIELLPAIAAALGDLGRVAQLEGRYRAALDSFDEALEILADLDDARGIAEFSLAKAETLLELGATETAKGLLEQASSRIDAGGNTEQQAELARLRAVAARLGGEPQEAARFLAAAKVHAQGSSAAAIQIAVRLEAASTAKEIPSLEEISERARRLGDARLTLLTGEALAEVQLAAGRAEEAERTARSALRRTESVGRYGRSYRLLFLVARSLEEQGETERALPFRQRAGKELERLVEGLDGDLSEHFRSFAALDDGARKPP